jgi:hypothetical protein
MDTEKLDRCPRERDIYGAEFRFVRERRLQLISARGGNSRLSALFLHVTKIGSCLIYRLLALWPENQITCPVISSFPVLLFVCLSPSHFRQWSARTVEFTNSYFPARLSRPRPMIRLLS